MTPRLLDLFCCAGGASMGYMRAGFDVEGMDINPQPNYPFKFTQGNVLDLDPAWIAENFDAVTGSPPCQHYSVTKSMHNNEHPDLVAPTRELLKATGLPYVIENVPGAPLEDPITLCGSSFALPIRRHRLFESNVKLSSPGCDHAWQNRHKPYIVHASSANRGRQETGVISVHGNEQHHDGVSWGKEYNIWIASVSMGIDWMRSKYELNQSIPPVYTYHIGRQLIRLLASVENKPTPTPIRVVGLPTTPTNTKEPKMQISLTFETPISAPDIAILRALAGEGQPAVTKPIAKETTTGTATPTKAAEPKVEKTPRELAIEKATALVGAGKHLKVKAALAEVSVARVSQLGDDDVEAFMAALEGDDA